MEDAISVLPKGPDFAMSAMPSFLPALCGFLGIVLFLVGAIWNLALAAEDSKSGCFSLWLDPVLLLCIPQSVWPFVFQVVGGALFFAGDCLHGA